MSLVFTISCFADTVDNNLTFRGLLVARYIELKKLWGNTFKMLTILQVIFIQGVSCA